MGTLHIEVQPNDFSGLMEQLENMKTEMQKKGEKAQ